MAKNMNRRDAVRLIAAAPLVAAFDVSLVEIARASSLSRAALASESGYEPRFFTPHEWATVRLLADIVIPRDERSGGATDAGVPEFMDFIMTDGGDDRRTAMRGGLAWLDTECRERFGTNFVDCSDGERKNILDDIAWPAKASPDMTHGVGFFNSFRNLTASGFWSSQMGVEDIGYIGNTAVPAWDGCPPEQLDRLGLRYE